MNLITVYLCISPKGSTWPSSVFQDFSWVIQAFLCLCMHVVLLAALPILNHAH